MPRLPTRRRIVAAALAMAIAAGAVTASAAPAVAQTFRISVAGIPIGSLSLEASEGGRAYAASGRVAANRALQIVAGLAFEGSASGVRDAAGMPRPAVFESVARGAGETRRARIEWRDGRPVAISSVPPPRQAPDPALLAGTIDPVSAAYLLFRSPPEQICNRRLDIFDGRRVQRLLVGPASVETEGTRCTGNLFERRADAGEQARQPVHAFWLKFAPDAGGQQRLVRVEFPTRFGQGVVARR